MKRDMGAVIEKYIDEHTDEVSPLLHDLLKETEEKTGRAWWSIGKIEGKFCNYL